MSPKDLELITQKFMKKRLGIISAFSQRMKNHPEFKNEIILLGVEGTGRKYKVSGTSIKKWVRTYEKYGV